MDPITRAARTFLREAEARWRADPQRILPIIAGPSERGQVMKALRLAELAPGNRRPLFLHDEPFIGPRDYFDSLIELVQAGYADIRSGVAEEGAAVPPFAPVSGVERDNASSIATAVATADRVAELLGDRFEGLCVALLPKQVGDVAAWRESIAALDRTRLSSRVRIAVFAPPGGPLDGVLTARGAHFRIDEDALDDYLRSLGRPEAEASGRELPRRREGMALLRELLLDAGRCTRAGDHAAAAERYCEARAHCAAEGRPIEEAIVLIALAGTCLSAGSPALAIQSYRRAGEIAGEQGIWEVVCQAWLGVGGAHLAGKAYEPAAIAYRSAAEAAKQGGIVEMRIEALRLAGTCHLIAGSEDGAIFAWQEAIQAGDGLDADARRRSTLCMVTAALRDLLWRRGLDRDAISAASMRA